VRRVQEPQARHDRAHTTTGKTRNRAK
jgi:hypothetical protein